MRQKITNVYTAAELKELGDGRAFERALEKYRENLTLDYVSDEMMDSLKGLCDAAGIRIRDYSLGAYNRGNRLRVEFPGDGGAGDLTGPRALAWIENHILGPLRAPWGLERKAWRRGQFHDVFNVEDGRVLRRWYSPGAVPACPFTGVCYDDDFLGALYADVKAGRSLKESFEGLEHDFARMLEDELEYQGKEDQFLEAAEVNEWEYDEDGRHV
jgi:hypothetical protein